MNIIDANDSALKQFGYSRNELNKKSITDLHTEDELDNSAVVLEKMKLENKLSIQTKFKRNDGSVFLAVATPCRYMIGEQPLIHVFIQDITEIKQSEKKLQELNLALQVEVAKVEKHSKQLESKNKELEEFAYVAAHDLKAPVTNLIALANMLDSDATMDKQSSELFC